MVYAERRLALLLKTVADQGHKPVLQASLLRNNEIFSQI